MCSFDYDSEKLLGELWRGENQPFTSSPEFEPVSCSLPQNENRLRGKEFTKRRRQREERKRRIKNNLFWMLSMTVLCSVQKDVKSVLQSRNNNCFHVHPLLQHQSRNFISPPANSINRNFTGTWSWVHLILLKLNLYRKRYEKLWKNSPFHLASALMYVCTKVCVKIQ
jgi:hypothetical protein